MADTPYAAGNSTTTSTLSDWAGPYVTNMLGKAQAYSNLPYQQYQGELTAGPSQLQSQAFQGLASLTLPQGSNYSPTSYASSYTAGTTNQSVAPNTYTSGYTAGNYSPSYSASNYDANSYSPTQFSSRLPGTSQADPYGVGSVQDYMNPYISGVLDPQLRELNRQATISQMANADRFAQAGAYGGSRQAIMDAELQRNLLQQISDTTGGAYKDAYDKALQQQMQTAQLGMQAQQNTEQSKQFGANFGLDTNKLNEAAKQFAGQLGLNTQQLNEQAKQFGSTANMQTNQLNEQAKQFANTFGLDAYRANEAARQAQATLGLNADQLAEQSKQFDANNALNQYQAQLGGLQQLMTAGNAQRDILQQGLNADYNQYLDERDYPQKMLEFQRNMLTGLPISTVQNTPNPASPLQQGIGSITDIMAALKQLGVV